MKKPNYYSILTAKVRYDNDLCPNAKLLFSEITSLSNKEGYCWATNEYFANLFNVSQRSVTRWITSLREKKYIYESIDKKSGNERKIYIFKDAYEEPQSAQYTELKRPDTIDKNIGSYNRYNNLNTNNTPYSPPYPVEALFTTPKFNDLFFICQLASKHAGKIQDAFIEYQKHKEIISEDDLKMAYLYYASDKKIAFGKYYGLANFLKNRIYLNYLRLKVRVELGDKTIEGEYDREHSKLICEDGTYYSFSPERFLELLRQDKIVISEKAA
ncbi:MAG: helix-turn-helix domain-containing protein [Campylobacteraceae bacterium]|jgi:DNA-binding transcriptional ArsR family regulator|nr:helix-turn-helix domain-containing protein [Campylobacteraceae bacterium]